MSANSFQLRIIHTSKIVPLSEWPGNGSLGAPVYFIYQIFYFQIWILILFAFIGSSSSLSLITSIRTNRM